jgi:hypothetical protein
MEVEGRSGSGGSRVHPSHPLGCACTGIMLLGVLSYLRELAFLLGPTLIISSPLTV